MMDSTISIVPPEVTQYCDDNGLGIVQEIHKLQGGVQSVARRLVTELGNRLILKQHPQAPADWYALEAEGLELLNIQGCPRVPNVLDVGLGYLLLEDIGDPLPPSKSSEKKYWESFGRSLAKLHLNIGPSFGFLHDNYLGLMPQRNTRTDDGHEFFISTRVLRYLYESIAEKTLTLEDRRGVERLCDRIRRDVPGQPASLCHGDLWTGNMLIDPNGDPAYIDPAIHYGWAEAELSLTRHFGGVPDYFYSAYIEINPLADGWEERLPLYELKEMLGLIAQFGSECEMVEPLRSLIRRFA